MYKYDEFPEELKEKEREAWEGIPWKNDIASISFLQHKEDSNDLLMIVVPVQGRKKVLSLDPRKEDARINFSVVLTLANTFCPKAMKKYYPKSEEELEQSVYCAIECLKKTFGFGAISKELLKKGYEYTEYRRKYVESIAERREDGSIYRHKILHGVNLKEI